MTSLSSLQANSGERKRAGLFGEFEADTLLRRVAGDRRGARCDGDGLGGEAARPGEFVVPGCARPLGNRAGGLQQGNAAGSARESGAGAERICRAGVTKNYPPPKT